MIKRPSALNIILAFPLCLSFFLVISGLNHKLQSASLQSVSVTSNNPRPSFRGVLGAGSNGTTVVINTTPNAYPSTSSGQLVEGDSLRIGQGGTMGSYTVASTSSESTFFTTTALATGDETSGNSVISTSSATLTVRFTTVSAIANGRFRILVPALAGANGSDGLPDGGFFDFGTSPAASVTCPNNTTAVYNFTGGSAATASAVTLNGTNYHVFECAYSGTGAVGTAFDGTTNNAITISNLINPAPKTNHTLGTADTYGVIIQQLNSTLDVQDSTTVSIAVIEAVRVTAAVPPQITFQILGLASGTSACGVATDVPTTPTSVPFGEISISSFTDAAQAMNVSTNATGGFVVTAQENDQLGRNGGACAGDPTVLSNPNCIPDARGNNGSMTQTTSDEWTNASITNGKGFGYSLDDVNGSTTPAFQYDTVAGTCTGTYCARQFSDTAGSETPVTIFSSASVADNQNLYVCYRIVAGTTTSAGNYENYVTYNATATF